MNLQEVRLQKLGDKLLEVKQEIEEVEGQKKVKISKKIKLGKGRIIKNKKK